MCRALTYLGAPLLLDNLLFSPDNSLIKQAYNPKLMSYIQNLAGFGMAVWDKNSFDPQRPYLYRTPGLPFYDENLKGFSEKAMTNCLLAHVRGVDYSHKEMIAQQNVHPFTLPNRRLAMAHNGQLAKFSQIKYQLLPYIKSHIAEEIFGTTDSEWIYAVFMSQLKVDDEDNPKAIKEALLKTFDIIKKIREDNHINIASPVNLFITNGDFIAVSRFVFDFGCYPETYERAHLLYHSLWYTFGEEFGCYDNEYRMSGSNNKASIIIASEPLTEDITTWIEVPEYSILIAQKNNNEISIGISNIDI